MSVSGTPTLISTGSSCTIWKTGRPALAISPTSIERFATKPSMGAVRVASARCFRAMFSAAVACSNAAWAWARSSFCPPARAISYCCREASYAALNFWKSFGGRLLDSYSSFIRWYSSWARS